MKIKKSNIIIGLLLAVLGSCMGIKTVYEKGNIGNFQEHKYDFFESFNHTTDNDYYYTLPFYLKSGGIRPFPYDSIGKQDYSWLRNPENLTVAFNTMFEIGLNKFVSIEQYNSNWQYDKQWKNKSLNQIVTEFIQSDTNSVNNDYYSEFWKRRRKENNLTESYTIFTQINRYYNGDPNSNEVAEIDVVLQNLLTFDMRLCKADSNNYSTTALEYFTYLKSVKLDYSAFKLLFHNQLLQFTKQEKDSLISTIKFDTLSPQDWENMNDNRDGWITWGSYHDPQRYYGP